MQVVIAAGGLGTRLSEETALRPKPMVEIGGKPMLRHIMNIYAQQGHTEFIVCLGYMGYYIKEWFANYFLYNCDVTIDLKTNQIEVHNNKSDDRKVTLVDTGVNTMTGGRVKRVAEYIKGDEFMFTYGDGVSDIDVNKLIEFHKANGKLATLTRVQPEGRFGKLVLEGDEVVKFGEKMDNKDAWVNWGFMVLNKKVLDYIDGDSISLEKEPVEKLATEHQLAAYPHTGFRKSMDTLRDKMELEEIWSSGNAPRKMSS